MTMYTLKLANDYEPYFNLYKGQTPVSTQGALDLFSTDGEAYFVIDFNSYTPQDDITLFTIGTLDGSLVLDYESTNPLIDGRDYQGSWLGFDFIQSGAGTFQTFTLTPGVVLDEGQISDLMGKIKNASPLLTNSQFNSILEDA